MLAKLRAGWDRLTWRLLMFFYKKLPPEKQAQIDAMIVRYAKEDKDDADATYREIVAGWDDLTEGQQQALLDQMETHRRQNTKAGRR